MSSESSSDESSNDYAVSDGKVKGGVKRNITIGDKQGEDLATKVAGGRKKSRIFMSMRTSSQFKDYLDKFLSVFDNLSKFSEDAQSTLLHSETIINDKRRYYFDLRENNRGRFLRITQTSAQAGTRFSIALPAQGIKQLRDILVELLAEFGDEGLVDLPEGRYVRAENNKIFYFDPGQNNRGTFLKISEVKPQVGLRSSITISARVLSQFSTVLNEMLPQIVNTVSSGKEIKKSESSA